MSIIEQIERLRLQKSMSKQELAHKSEITPDYYTKIITGKAPGVAHSIIERLCNAVGIKILYYIDIQDK